MDKNPKDTKMLLDWALRRGSQKLTETRNARNRICLEIVCIATGLLALWVMNAK